MHDRPTAAELVSAARQFLEGELLPALADARLRFQTLIAAHVLSMVERELQQEEAHLRAEWQALHALLGLFEPEPSDLAGLRAGVREANARLCERIQQGDFDAPPRADALLRCLHESVERKLTVANPRYLAAFRPV